MIISERNKKELKKYMRRTMANKVISLIMILIGMGSYVLIKDPFIFVFTLIIGLPLFFTRKNYVEIKD